MHMSPLHPSVAAQVARDDVLDAAIAVRHLTISELPTGTIRQMLDAEHALAEAVDRYTTLTAQTSPHGAARAAWRGPGLYDVAVLDGTGSSSATVAADTVDDIALAIGDLTPKNVRPSFHAEWTGPIPGSRS